MLTFLRRLFWPHCQRHRIAYDSDMCPRCNTERFISAQTHEGEPRIETSLAVRRMLPIKPCRIISEGTVTIYENLS